MTLFIDNRNELARIERFAKKSIHAGFQTLFLILNEGVGCHGHDKGVTMIG